MHMISENEMRGFLSNLSSLLRDEQREQAAIEHFFTCCVFPDMPKDVGYAWATNLRKFIRLSTLRAETQVPSSTPKVNQE